MIVLAVSVQNFAQPGGRAEYLRPFIWSRVSGMTRFRDGSDIECASNFVQISEKMQVLKQASKEESMNRKRKVLTHRHRNRKMGDK
jgi:hypothetical protein